MIFVYTDGACLGNPGPGGWGAILYRGQTRTTFSGGAPHTTNNRMELSAAIFGLRGALAHTHDAVTLVSDSKYVIEGITHWIQGWQRNGWKTSQKKPVENQDLWQELAALKDQFSDLSFRWVKGHSGDPRNEEADALARQAIPSA